MKYIYDKNGRKREIADLVAIERLEKLKADSGSNPWPVIGECINIWVKKNPSKWDSYLLYLKDIRETRKETVIGGKSFKGVSRGDEKNDGITSYTLDIPQPIMFMMRAMYTHEELPMNKEFFEEFGWKFPQFRIREAK